MRPVLFELGGQPLYGYWFFGGLGGLVGVLICIWLSGRRALPFWSVWLVCFAAVFAALAFSRVSYLFIDPSFNPVSSLLQGGEVSFGGIFGTVLTIIVAGTVLKLPLRDLLDAMAPAIFLGNAVQRLGCFCNGCCHGQALNSFLSVRFPQIVNPSGEIIGTPCFQHHLALGLVDRTELYSLPVVPMQLVSMALSLLIGGIGLWLFLQGQARGRVMWISFILYGTLRFGTQRFRPNYDGGDAVAGWNIGHTMSVGMIVIGIALFFLTKQALSRNEGDARYRRRLADGSRSEASKARLSKIAARKVKRSNG